MSTIGDFSLPADAHWRFRPGYKDFGRDFANPAWLVFEPSVRSIVREGTQNARDAALPGQGPAELIIRVHRVSGKRLDVFLKAMGWDELEEHIAASAAQPGKFGSILRRGLRAVKNRDLIAVTFNDFNTVGLIGSEEGPDELKGASGEHFAALVRRSFDSQKSGSSGGSYGLGRNAALSGSLFRTAFYCSTLSTPYDGHWRNRFIGRTDLGARRLGTQAYAGPGWFGAPFGDEAVVSLWNDAQRCKALFLQRDPLRPDSTGTSVLIPAFFDPANERVSVDDLCSEIARIAATDFWPAIYDDKLTVSVEAYDNDDRTAIIAVDPRSYRPHHVEMYASLKDGTSGSEFTEEIGVVKRDIEVDVPARKDEGKTIVPAVTHRAILLVSRAEDASDDTNRVLGFRGPGMIVQERPYSIFSALGPRFRALLLVGTAAEEPPVGDIAEQFFSAAEPPAHDKWTHTAVGISEYYRGGKKALESLSASVRETLADVLRSVKSSGAKGPDIILKSFRISDNGGAPEDPPAPPPPPPTNVRVQRYSWEQRGDERLVLVTVKKPRGSSRVAPALSCVFEDGGSAHVPIAAIYPAANSSLAEPGYVEVTGDEPTASFLLEPNWAAAELDPQYSVLSVSISKQYSVNNA